MAVHFMVQLVKFFIKIILYFYNKQIHFKL